MAIRKRGSHRIVVDGIACRWKVPQLNEDQEAGRPGMAAAVQQVEPAGSQLWLVLPTRYSMRSPLANEGKPILPSEVASGIRAAIASGWKADRPGKQFCFQMFADGAEAEASRSASSPNQPVNLTRSRRRFTVLAC